MNGQVTIYALAHPENPKLIKYIGKTEKPLHRRLCEHVAERNRPQRNARKNWVRSLFQEGLTPVIWPIEICTRDNWVEREQFWIRLFRGLGLKNGTDGGEGGTGNRGWKWSPEALKRVSEMRRGKKLSPKNAAARRIQLYEKAIPLARTPEARAKAAATRASKKPTFGKQINLFRPYAFKKRPRDIVEKCAEKMRGRARPHVVMPGGKAVECIETGERFVSIWRAAQAKGVACNKIRKSFKTGSSTKGLHWRLI